MKKYHIFFDGDTARVEVNDRHTARRLSWTDESLPGRPFANTLFRARQETGWLHLATAILMDVDPSNTTNALVYECLNRMLMEKERPVIGMTASELSAFCWGAAWMQCIMEDREKTPPDRNLSEGGI